MSQKRNKSQSSRSRQFGHVEVFEPRRLMAVVSVDNLDTTPDNPQCGSLQNPCSSIQQGINQANPGDDLLLASRSYAESFVINKSLRIVSDGAPATLSAGDGAVITVEGDQPQPLQVLLENLRVTGADQGVVARGSADLHVVEVEIAEHRDVGLYYEGDGQIFLQGVSVAGNQGDGVSIVGDCSIQLHDVLVASNAGSGVAIEGARDASIQGGAFVDNGLHGLHLSSTKGPLTIEGVDASGNRLNGMLLNQIDGELTVAESAAEFNLGNGVQVVEKTGTALLEGLRVVENDSGGVVVENADRLTLRSGQFHGNRLNDVSLSQIGDVIVDAVPGMQSRQGNTDHIGDQLYKSDLQQYSFTSVAEYNAEIQSLDRKIADAEGRRQQANRDVAAADAQLATIKGEATQAQSDLDTANGEANDANTAAQQERQLQANHQGKANSGPEKDDELADEYEAEKKAEIDAAREEYERATQRIIDILDSMDRMQRELDGTNDPERARILRGALNAAKDVLDDAKQKQHDANDAYLEKNPQGPGSDRTKADRQRDTEQQRATAAERRAAAAESRKAAAEARAQAARDRVAKKAEARRQAEQRKADARRRRIQAERDKAAAEKEKKQTQQAEAERRRAKAAQERRDKLRRDRARREFEQFNLNENVDVTVFKNKDDITLEDIQAQVGKRLLKSNDPVLERIGLDLTIEDAKRGISKLNGLAARAALTGLKMFVSRGLQLGLGGPVGGFLIERVVTSMLATDPEKIEIGSFPMEAGSFVGRGKILFNRETCEYLFRIDLYFPSWGNNTPIGVVTDRTYTVVLGGKVSSGRTNRAVAAVDAPHNAGDATMEAGFNGPLVGNDPAKVTLESGTSTDNAVIRFSEPVVGLRATDFRLGTGDGALQSLGSDAWLETDDGQTYTLRGLDQVMRQPGAYRLHLDAVDAAVTTVSGFDFVQESNLDLERIAGDSNADGRFDESDLVAIFQAGKYRSGESATFAEGDWNDDGRFDETDLIAALKLGHFRA